MRLLNPKNGEVGQGYIFNCVRVPNYEGCSCSGIVITARCDLAHCKQSSISFLPIVSIGDWIERDFCRLLAGRLIKKIQNSINEIFKNANVDNTLLNVFSIEEVIDKELAKEDKKKVTRLYSELALIQNALQSNGKRFNEVQQLWGSGNREAKKIIEELVSQKISDYYYLNDVNVTSNKDEGFVILMRGFCSAPTTIFEKIVQGIDHSEIRASSDLFSLLDPDADTMCLITGVLRSPDIEHLAQAFGNLFSRIGLADQALETARRIADKYNIKSR